MVKTIKKVEIFIGTDNLVDYHVPIDKEIMELPRMKGANLIGEHGLSFYINIFYENEKYILLFDTGSINCTILNNFAQLNLNINEINAIAISHGHYDHTGCLIKILEEISNSQNLQLYIHPDAFCERFFNRNKENTKDKLLGKTRKEIKRLEGIFYPQRVDYDSILKYIKKENLQLINITTEIFPNVHITGEIPRINNIEIVSSFYCWKSSEKEKLTEKDEIFDDQTVFIDLGEDKGLLIILGCTHSGLLNTLNFIKKRFDRKISCIIGGMHLVNASEKRINETITYLKNLQIENPKLIIIPLHCSGIKFKDKLKLELRNVYDLGVGTKLTF